MSETKRTATNEKPRRPRNSFMLYAQDMRPHFPGESGQSKAVIIARLWRAESESIKNSYHLLAEIEKAERKRKYPHYRCKPNPKRENVRTVNKAQTKLKPVNYAGVHCFGDAHDAPPLLTLPYPFAPSPCSSNSDFSDDESDEPATPLGSFHIFSALPSASSDPKATSAEGDNIAGDIDLEALFPLSENNLLNFDASTVFPTPASKSIPADMKAGSEAAPEGGSQESLAEYLHAKLDLHLALTAFSDPQRQMSVDVPTSDTTVYCGIEPKSVSKVEDIEVDIASPSIQHAKCPEPRAGMGLQKEFTVSLSIFMSSSDSSSSSSEREKTPPPKKSKVKGSKKAVPGPSGSGKNEGPDPNWDYKPPAGVTLLQDATDAGGFDWDAIANDDDIELCLIRVPESIKPKYLENLTLERLPTSKKTVRAATISRKHATFDIWSVGEEEDVNIGGEEIKALSCFLPRKSKKGKLYPAPKPISRHFVVAAQAVVPTADSSSTGPIQPYSRPPRENYPKEVLTHAFKPYGSVGGEKVNAEDDMEVDVPVPQPTIPASPKQKKAKHAKAGSPEVEKKTKGKKRKGEGVEASVEKKPKKAKTAKS
ncbi:hypothetical protein DXG01_008601 [Tephrocybe rancida]|nr:hypothetical protein DXG01_008601 [Tephrocybe rancida]